MAQVTLSGTNLGGTQIGHQTVSNEPTSSIQEVAKWLSPINGAQKQKDIYSSDYRNSKDSFFRSEEFDHWEHGDISLLWCHGIAGSGKTVLTSLIYEYLRSIQAPHTKVGVACIYCDSQQQAIQTPENLLGSLWPQLQLCTGEKNISAVVKSLYKAHLEHRTRPSLDQILNVLQTTINGFKKTYILIDAMDECSDLKKQEALKESMLRLIGASVTSKTKVHVLFTSRIPDASLGATVIELHANTDEIRSMLTRRIAEPHSFMRGLRGKIAADQVIQSRILNSIIGKANGMFLIANLQINMLTTAVSIANLYDMLRTMSEKLDEYYEAAWVRVTNQGPHLEELARHTIAWLLLGGRHFTIEELQHALAVRPGDVDLNRDSLIDISDISEVCQGLVVVQEHSNTIRLAHTTVEEFFRKNVYQLLKEASTYLASTCLTYLCFDDLGKSSCESLSIEGVKQGAEAEENSDYHTSFEARLVKYPLLDYAASWWGFHASEFHPGLDVEESCIPLITTFLNSSHKLQNAHMAHSQVFHGTCFERLEAPDCEDVFPLRVAVSFRLERSACLLIESSYPAYQGLENIEHAHQLLLTMLEAVDNGLEVVVHELLKAGVDPFSPTELPLTIIEDPFPILDHNSYRVARRPRTVIEQSEQTAQRGHREFTRLLMTWAIERSLPMRFDYTYAVSLDDHHAVDIYLSGFPDDHQRRNMANQVLDYACRNGSMGCISSSLEHGAAVESANPEDGSTALALAVRYGHANAVKALLEADANVMTPYWETSDDPSRPKSLLQGAAASQEVFRDVLNSMVVHLKYLIETPKPARPRMPPHSVTIIWAWSRALSLENSLSRWLSKETGPLQILRNQEFLTCIREDTNHSKIITMLLDHDVDISVRGEDGESLLHMSIISKPRAEALLQYINERPDVDLEVDARDNNGRMPLHHAAVACNAEVMELLIEHGAEVAATDNNGVTTVHFAVYSPRCIEVTRKHGGNPNTAHADLGTPLEFARRVPESNHHAVTLLESLMPQIGEGENTLAQTVQSPRDDLRGDSEIFYELTRWMVAHKEKHKILCRRNIARHLRASQETGVDEEELSRVERNSIFTS